jgi:hypothetical protein
VIVYCWFVASGDAVILSTCIPLGNGALPKKRIFFGDFSILLQQTLYGRTFRHVPLQLSLCTRPQICFFFIADVSTETEETYVSLYPATRIEHATEHCYNLRVTFGPYIRF